MAAVGSEASGEHTAAAEGGEAEELKKDLAGARAELAAVRK